MSIVSYELLSRVAVGFGVDGFIVYSQVKLTEFRSPAKFSVTLVDGEDMEFVRSALDQVRLVLVVAL